ncbi:MAG: SRPBCC domain-containing protein, partial [Caulobacteraceae bacterium]|nr:SRPBCC domain-containing protein [Caulobacteraceae bacterium]
EVALPGQKPRAIRPVVADWIPNEQIHWTLRLWGGLVRTTRYLEIEKLTEEGCIFSNGEMFDGPLGPTIARRLGAPLRAGFRAMGEAVKARVEAAR